MKANLYFFLLIFLAFILFLLNFQKESPNNEFLVISHPQKIQNYYKVKAVNLKNKENYFLYLNEEVSLGEKLILDNFEIKENRIYFPKIFQKEKAYIIFRISSKVKNFYDEKIKKNLPWPEENILRGLIFGENIEDKDLYKNFQKVGISHILVASGSNLVLVFSIFLSFLKNLKLDYKISLLISIFILLFYLFLVGFEGSILRAFIFILFLIFIKSFSGRIPLKRNIILTALIIILLVFPKEIFEIGTILSFLSFLGIIYISPFIKEKLSFLKSDYLKETISQSFSSFILVFPFLGFVFNSLNPFGLFFNLPVLFLLPTIFILGIFISPLPYFSFILYPPLLFIRKIAELGNFLPEINLLLPSYFYLTFYFVTLFLIYKINKNENIEFNFNFR
jgi:competence protein ComEC